MQIAESKEAARTIAAMAGRPDTTTAAAAEPKIAARLQTRGGAPVSHASSAGLRIPLKASKPTMFEGIQLSSFDKITPPHPSHDTAPAAA